MRCLIAISLLFVALAGMPGTPPVSAQAEDDTAGMSGIDILEGLTSQDPGIRDRAKEELPLMGEKAAKDLGREILLAGVREAQTALGYIGRSGNKHAVHAAAAALESDEYDVRATALDALVHLSPKHTHEADEKAFKADRKQAIRKLIEDSRYVQELCEGLAREEDGQLQLPVTRAMRLMALLDHLYAEDAMSLLLERLGVLMLGEPLEDEKQDTQTQRDEAERLRRSAALWCEAVWITDPAIAFNYSPVAPFKDRQKAVNRLLEKLGKLNEVYVFDYEENRDKYGTVKRYGDYLLYVPRGDYVKESKMEAYLRLKWWRGDEVVLEGETYTESFEGVNSMRRRHLSQLWVELGDWWRKRKSDDQD